MRVKVTKRQFTILIDNFNLIGNRGLYLKMTGKTAKEVIDESFNYKSYLVRFSMNGYKSAIEVNASNITRAKQIASKLLPSAKIFNVTEIKGGNHC